MKNIQGKTENLELFSKNGKLVYEFITDSNGFSYEATYDGNGNELTYRNSNGFSYENTYDEKGKILTYRNSDGHYSEFIYEYTYDDNGNKLTYKDSNGVLQKL